MAYVPSTSRLSVDLITSLQIQALDLGFGNDGKQNGNYYSILVLYRDYIEIIWGLYIGVILG